MPMMKLTQEREIALGMIGPEPNKNVRARRDILIATRSLQCGYTDLETLSRLFATGILQQLFKGLIGRSERI